LDFNSKQKMSKQQNHTKQGRIIPSICFDEKSRTAKCHFKRQKKRLHAINKEDATHVENLVPQTAQSNVWEANPIWVLLFKLG